MDRDKLRAHLDRREEEEANKGNNFITKDQWLSIKNGENRFKILNRQDPTTGLFWRSVYLQWVPTGGRSATPFKFVEGSALDRVQAVMKNSKNPGLKQIASRMRKVEHGLAFAIDAETLQLKVLNTPIKGIDAIAAFICDNVKEGDTVMKASNKAVLVVKKRVEQVTKNNNTFNQSFYDVTVEEDENFQLLPKVKKQIKEELPNIDGAYENFDESYAIGLLDKTLEDFGTSVAKLLGSESTGSGSAGSSGSSGVVVVDEDEDLFAASTGNVVVGTDENTKVTAEAEVVPELIESATTEGDTAVDTTASSAMPGAVTDNDLDDIDKFLRDGVE